MDLFFAIILQMQVLLTLCLCYGIKFSKLQENLNYRWVFTYMLHVFLILVVLIGCQSDKTVTVTEKVPRDVAINLAGKWKCPIYESKVLSIL